MGLHGNAATAGVVPKAAGPVCGCINDLSSASRLYLRYADLLLQRRTPSMPNWRRDGVNRQRRSRCTDRGWVSLTLQDVLLINIISEKQRYETSILLKHPLTGISAYSIGRSALRRKLQLGESSYAYRAIQAGNEARYYPPFEGGFREASSGFQTGQRLLD